MNPLAYAASAFFISWVVSRAARWFLFKRAVGWRRAVLPNLLTMAMLILLEVVSSPGGASVMVGALILYAPAAIILSLLDLLILYVKRPRQTESARP